MGKNYVVLIKMDETSIKMIKYNDDVNVADCCHGQRPAGNMLRGPKLFDWPGARLGSLDHGHSAALSLEGVQHRAP
jgi:hypothetical protein